MGNWMTVREVLDWIRIQDPGMGILLITAGIIFIVYGWRLSHLMIVLSTGGVGAIVALIATESWVTALVCALIGLALGVVCVIKAMRYAVAILTGLWSAYLIGAMFVRFGAADNLVYLIALILFVSVASVTLTSIRPAVAFITSVQGTILLLMGALIILSSTSTWYGFLQSALADNPIFLPFLLLAGIVSGYYFQLADIQERDSGMAG
jgi:hypothetical protein